MRYFSLFSGIGGFELGIKAAYHNRYRRAEKEPSLDDRVPADTYNAQRPICVGFSEIDKYAISIYQRHFPAHTNYGDITKVSPQDIPDFDLLVGGFPCQAFSIAGKRRGFADTRGTLFFDIARIVGQKQPRLLLLENVKGLLSHDEGRTFTTIITTLDELGYDCQWQVLNSKNHGVPQNRERVFIVGHLRGSPRPEVFPFGTKASRDLRDTGRTVSFCLDGHYYKGISARGYQGKRRQLVADGKIRRLTPAECERLQSFPDGWTGRGVEMTDWQESAKGIHQNYRLVDISDTQRYKSLGNAVTVNVIADVASRFI